MSGIHLEVERAPGVSYEPSFLEDAARRSLRWREGSAARIEALPTVEAPSGERLAIKLRRVPPLRSLWQTLHVRRSRARSALSLGHAFVRAGVPTARPIAVVTARDEARRVVWEALIAGYVGDSDLGRRLLREPDRQNEWIRAAAGAISTMHRAGFVHRDLKASNVLVGGAGARSQAWIIDLDGAARRRLPITLARRARDVARLFVSLEVLGAAAEVLVHEYAAATAMSPEATESMLRRIEAYARNKRMQNMRRGRPLT